MAVIHISQEEAERDFASVLKRLDATTSFVIENGAKSVSTLVATGKPPVDPSLSATIARLSDDPNIYVDDGFAGAVQDFIDRHRDPFDLSYLE